MHDVAVYTIIVNVEVKAASFSADILFKTLSSINMYKASVEGRTNQEIGLYST